MDEESEQSVPRRARPFNALAKKAAEFDNTFH
jgi:hypothetical protein